MRHVVKYRDFEISPSLVSYQPEHDWSYSHVDYDGAPDANDDRCGVAGSVESAMAEIDEWYFEPLTDHTEASRIIAELRAERDNLHGRLFAESEAVQFYRAAAIDNRKRAEKAEALIAELVEGLEAVTKSLDSYWQQDERGAEFIGMLIERARSLLAKARAGQ